MQLAVAKDMNTLNTILNKTGPLDLSQLSDNIENEFNPDSFAKILIKGILAGDSIEQITVKAFKKLPKKLETDDHRLEIKKLVTQSIQNLLPQVDSKTADEFLKVNPEVVSPTDISTNGMAFVAKEGHEDLRLHVYRDPVGYPTIGFGHKIKNQSELIEFKNGITKEKAFELYRKDLNDAVVAVKGYVRVPINQQRFDALVSLVYNMGPGNFAKSSLLKVLNSGDYEGAADEFKKYRTGYNQKTKTRVVLPGLVKRRAAEENLFRNGIY